MGVSRGGPPSQRRQIKTGNSKQPNDESNVLVICFQGDSGGPLNCPDGGVTVVAGIISWGISSGAGNCVLTYPSVCTRTSAYLDWIAANAP